MATGYTKALEDTGYNVSRWLKQHVIRAMGVAVMLRDAPFDLSEEEVGKRILASNQESIDSARTSLELSNTRLSQALTRSNAEWKKKYEKERTEAEADLNKRLDTWNRDKKEHQKALAECQRLYTIALETHPENSVEVGTLKFAVSQLKETIEWDFKSLPYSDSVLTTPLAEWKEQQIKSERHSVECAKERYQKTLDRETDRGKGYLNFVKFINENVEKKS